MKRKTLNLLIASLFVSTIGISSNIHAVDMYGVPPNIQQRLDALASLNPGLNFRYGTDGSITLETEGNAQKFFPLLPNPNVEQQDIGGGFVINSDGTATFGGDTGMMYVPTVQEGFSYPSFPHGFLPPEGSEIPANVALPPGFVAPAGVEYNKDKIPPLNVASFLERQGIKGFEQGEDGSILLNGQTFLPFFGFTDEIGIPPAGADPKLKFEDDGTVTFPDGSIFYLQKVGEDGAPIPSVDCCYPPGFVPEVNEDGSIILPVGSLPEGVRLPPGAVVNPDGSITLPKPPDFVDAFPGEDPQFLGASPNNDGTFTLADGTVVHAPPIIGDGFEIDPATGQPIKDGMFLEFTNDYLPIDPFTGQAFIPGQLDQLPIGGLGQIQFDDKTGFPIHPVFGIPFDPFTGQVMNDEGGFRPDSPFLLTGCHLSTVICPSIPHTTPEVDAVKAMVDELAHAGGYSCTVGAMCSDGYQPDRDVAPPPVEHSEDNIHEDPNGENPIIDTVYCNPGNDAFVECFGIIDSDEAVQGPVSPAGIPIPPKPHA